MTWRIKVSYVHDQAPRALTTQLVKHITRRSGTRIFSLGLVLSAAAVAAKLCTPDATSGWRVVVALQASRVGDRLDGVRHCLGHGLDHRGHRRHRRRDRRRHRGAARRVAQPRRRAPEDAVGEEGDAARHDGGDVERGDAHLVRVRVRVRVRARARARVRAGAGARVRVRVRVRRWPPWRGGRS